MNVKKNNCKEIILSRKMSGKWNTIKDDFQGNFFKDFYNSQGDYEDAGSTIQNDKDKENDECGN